MFGQTNICLFESYDDFLHISFDKNIYINAYDKKKEKNSLTWYQASS